MIGQAMGIATAMASRGQYMKTLSKIAMITAASAGALTLAAATLPRRGGFTSEAVYAQALRTATPFQDNNGSVPSKAAYSGPLFTTSHAWPTAPLPDLKNAPWQVAIGNGPITRQNAAAYVRALKAAVTANGRQLIMHYESWNAARAGWYNEPWLGSQREAIHGTYQAGNFGPSVFPETGLDTDFNTHVLTYYDRRAAYTLNRFWGPSAMKPTMRTQDSQFAEGSIIVKAAVFASTDPKKPLNWWRAMRGAEVWPLYLAPNEKSAVQVWPGYVAQFDVIVKDSQSAPDTGWVYATLVYDSRAPGDVWDKMVPLGAQWGNDPQATAAGMPLKENWINPDAPTYSKQTLGWGGRLSGPNDGARNTIAVNGKVLKNEPDSSCMSCHSTAQWDAKLQKMPTFLLPSFPPDSTARPYLRCGNDGKPVAGDAPPKAGDNICSPAPGSAEWMKWFQNRKGDVAMDPGAFATDFDEVFSFKALKLWWLATGPAGQPVPMLLRTPRFNQYTGAPLN